MLYNEPTFHFTFGHALEFFLLCFVAGCGGGGSHAKKTDSKTSQDDNWDGKKAK
jgi:hypothetical protein